MRWLPVVRIGAAIAKRLATDGAAVAITYAKAGKAASGVVEAIEREGGKAVAIQAEAANAEAMNAAVETTVTTFGRANRPPYTVLSFA